MGVLINSAKRAPQILLAIRRGIVQIDKEIFQKTYGAFVRSRLQYAIQACRPWLRKEYVQLERVQVRDTKMVKNLSHLPHGARLAVLDLFPLNYRQLGGDLIKTYWIVRVRECALEFADFFKLAGTVHLRGHPFKLQRKFIHADIRRNVFSQRVVGTWNGLSARRKLFVGGLTSETSEKNLNEYFLNFGEVVSCAVKVCRETGQSRGFGFVVFKDEDSVKKVLSAPEHRLNGKKIDPKPAKCNKDTQRKVFVGGLDPEVTQEQVEEHFSQFGKVEAVDLPFDNIKGRRKNYVFVVFSSENEAKKAASVERQEICGKSCDVRVAVHRETSFRQRAQLQQSPLELQQMLFNLTYALNAAPINPAFLLHNPLAVTGSLNPWNFTTNQHLSCPQRPDGMRAGRAGTNNSVVKTNFRPSVFGVDSQYVNGVDKHPGSQYAANLASQFNSSVSLNPSTSTNLATAESAWDPANSSSENSLSRPQQQTAQQQQGPSMQHSGGVYASSTSSVPAANSIAPSSAYALRSVDYTNGGSPYLTFAQPGYQFQPGQSSMPYFYPVGPSGSYLAAAAAAAAAGGGGVGAGQNPNLYHQHMAASALGAGPQATGAMQPNASPAATPGFHQIGLPNPNLQGPFVNDFMTMLAANQVGMPFLAYPPNATAGLVGLQFRQQTMNPYYQPANNSTTDGISALSGYPSTDPSAPRPLLYGTGGPTTVATTSTGSVKHTLLSPHYGGDQQSRPTAPRHAARQSYNANSGSNMANASYQRPSSGSNSVGRGGGGGGGRFSCSQQLSTTSTEIAKPSANGDCPNTSISTRPGEEEVTTMSAEKQPIKTPKSSSPTVKHLQPATLEVLPAREDKAQNDKALPQVTSSLAVAAGSKEITEKLGATGTLQSHSGKKNNQASQTTGSVVASLTNGVKHETSESVPSAADSYPLSETRVRHFQPFPLFCLPYYSPSIDLALSTPALRVNPEFLPLTVAQKVMLPSQDCVSLPCPRGNWWIGDRKKKKKKKKKKKEEKEKKKFFWIPARTCHEILSQIRGVEAHERSTYRAQYNKQENRSLHAYTNVSWLSRDKTPCLKLSCIH
ncbi:unnamed protein product [Schistocephalus solidus]|uniref:RRM domain-containing protein n=1 Tax=Schistocephalus solidus TaxID=70667 RepID=A0A3P7CRX3_SCHSO|nr:unnamed protein product [Schistocephalus solidus]